MGVEILTPPLQDGEVTTAKIANSAVTAGKLSFDPATQAELDAAVGHVRQLLAQCSDNDSTLQSPTNTSATFAAVDAVRLEPVTFTAPASGLVEVEMEAYCFVTFATALTTLQWGILQGGSILAGSYGHVAAAATSGKEANGRKVFKCQIAVTPAASLTWTWAWRRAAGSGTCQMFWGGTDGVGLGVYNEASMKIWTVPTPLA